MATQGRKQEYREQLEERINDIEGLIGYKLDEPHTAESISDQVFKLKETVMKSLNSLSKEIREKVEEGI